MNLSVKPFQHFEQTIYLRIITSIMRNAIARNFWKFNAELLFRVIVSNGKWHIMHIRLSKSSK